MEDLHRKYRPDDFKSVIGQDSTIKSLEGLFKEGKPPHVFLFTGPSGVGKTTLGRIIAKKIGCSSAGLIEIDAATNNGIDAMRELTSSVRYKGFGNRDTKVVILDECHSLSKAAWQSLLKDLEDTPAHVFYILCTTEPDKVPKTIKTRSHHYTLSDVKTDDLIDLIDYVCDKEGFQLDDRQIAAIARESQGSPRMALVHLSMCKCAETHAEVREILKAAEGGKDFIAVARAIVSCRPSGMEGFLNAKNIISEFDVPPETFRLSLTSYVTKCVASKSPRNVLWLLHILSCLQGGPYNPSEKMAPVFVALGDIFLEEEEEEEEDE